MPPPEEVNPENIVTSSRRKTKVDYAALDYMSDEELRLSDEDANGQTHPINEDEGRGRKKNKSHAKAALALQAQGNTGPIGFVEKGYMYEASIRDLYTFEPVYEPDGSPSIERIVGRRPVRDDIRGIMEEGGEGEVGKNKRREQMMIARKAAMEMVRGERNGVAGASAVIEYEYLIKFKNQSYLHAKWMKVGDISSAGKQAKTMINRWHKKLVGGKEDPDQLEDPTIELGWVEAERVIGKKIRDEWIEMTEAEMKEYEAAEAAEEDAEGEDEEGDDKEDEGEKRPRTAFTFYQVLNAEEGSEEKWEAMEEGEKRVYQKLNEEESNLYEFHVTLHEKAMSNNTSTWQPVRRCQAVLDRICLEGFSDIFRDPVDTDYFTDYLDLIATPMDLRTVREKLDQNKYKLPEDFARDLRKIWKNCKAKCGMSALKPKLTVAPEGIWHCPRCRNLDVARLPSKAAEAAVKRRAEAKEIPLKAVPTLYYLVKWKGLGYVDCSWEKKCDLENDAGKAAIEAFAKEAEEAPKDLVMDKELGNVKELAADLAVRSAMDDIVNIVSRCPADTWAHAKGRTFSTGLKWDSDDKANENDKYKDLNVGEYEIVVPASPHGVGMTFKLCNLCWPVVTSFEGKSKQTGLPIESLAKYKDTVKVGDVIIGVNGRSMIGKDASSVKNIIEHEERKRGNNYLYMRFLRMSSTTKNVYFTSFSYFGKSMKDDVIAKLNEERVNILDASDHIFGEYGKIIEEWEEVEEEKGDGDENSQKGSQKEPVDSDEEDFEIDEDLLEREDRSDYKKKTAMQKAESEKKRKAREAQEARELKKKQKEEKIKARNDRVPRSKGDKDEPLVLMGLPSTLMATYNHQRRSIFDMVGVDVGESSDDESPEERRDWFMGGTGVFSEAVHRDGWKEDPSEDAIPVKTKNHQFLEALPKHVNSMAMTYTEPPDPKVWTNYPLEEIKDVTTPARILTGALERKAEQEGQRRAVEQIDKDSWKVIKIWTSIAQASITLGIPATRIKNIAEGLLKEEVNGGDQMDVEKKEEEGEKKEEEGEKKEGEGEKKEGKEQGTAGGFVWRYGKMSDFDDDDEEMAAWVTKLYNHENPRAYKNNNALRDYQVDGVNWLSSGWYQKRGSILADEMGLGKTVQIVCYLEHLWRVEKCPGPFLVVIPLSTVAHWKRELAGWTDMKYCIYHDRQREWRDVMREYEWYYEDRPKTFDFLKFNVLVTTYDTLIADFDIIGEIPFRSTIVDEAHRLRNQKGKLLEVMKDLHDRAEQEYDFQHRILITGTPLQNNMDELWTLLNFVDPDVFDNQYDFDYAYGNLTDAKAVSELQELISPYMLRRVKEDVAKDIPRKEETVIDVELTSTQRLYYRAIFENNHSFLTAKTGAKTQKLQNVQMELRKCCNHPFLLEGGEGMVVQQEEPQGDDQGLVASSGKMVLLDKLLPKLKKEGHKVLIFSQMVRMLDVIADYCNYRAFEYEILDGRISGSERQKSIDRYNQDADSFIFLLSTRAGGVGINLTAADTVIIFDSDWNPQNDVQAQARCHRIGQTKDVMIYRLITARSFEQEMFDRASKKLGLEQAVLGTFQAEDNDGMPTASEMEKLLKQGAYAMMSGGDGDDDATKSFEKDDIDTILSRRTRTRVVEGAKNSSWLNKTGHAVNRQSFGGKMNQIDIDDPEFWNKVMPGFCNVDILTRKLKDMEKEMRVEKVEREKKIKEEQEAALRNSRSDEMNKEIEKEKEEEVEKLKRMKKRSGRADSSDEEDEEGNVIDTRTQKVKDEATAFVTDTRKVVKDLIAQIELGRINNDEMEAANNLLITASQKRKLFTEIQRETCRQLLMEMQGDRRRKRPQEEGRGGRGGGRRGGGRRKVRKFGDDDDDGWGEDEGYGESKKSRKVKGEFMSRQEAISMYGAGWAEGISDEDKLNLDWPDINKDINTAIIKRVMNMLMDEDRIINRGGFSQQIGESEGKVKRLSYSSIAENIVTYKRPYELQKDLRIMYNNLIETHGASSDEMKELRRQMLKAVDFFKEACNDSGLFLGPTGRPIEVFTDSEGDEDAFDSDDDEFVDDEPIRRRGGGGGATRMVRCRECNACNSEDCGKCSACKDKVKFGGPGRLKQCCKRRICKNKRPGQGRKPKGEGVGRGNGRRKARSLAYTTPIPASEEDGEGGVRVETPVEPKTPKKRTLVSSGLIDSVVFAVDAKRPKAEQALLVGAVIRGPEDSKMFDLIKLVGEQNKTSLDFDAITEWTQGIGRWILPEALKDVPGAFEEVTLIVVEKLKAKDKEKKFFKPNTSLKWVETMDNPMGSLEQVVDKLKAGGYMGATVAEKIGSVHDDLMVMLANCILFHDEPKETELVEEACKLYLALPAIFASAILSRMGEHPPREVTDVITGLDGRLNEFGEYEKLGRIVCAGGEGKGGEDGGKVGEAFWEGRVRGIVVGVG
ncbi:hypothetical protein TrRE_jg12733, partial [Triparma retinervis]